MPRPKIPRCLKFSPQARYFKPRGIPLCELEEVVLLPEELEALKLYEVDDLEQLEAAKKMKVSQPTFARILGSASKKIAQALVNGMAIRILPVLFLWFSLVFGLLSPSFALAQDAPPIEVLEGKVVQIIEEKQTSPSEIEKPHLYQKLEILVTKGSLKDKRIVVENGQFASSNLQKYQVGDRVVINSSPSPQGHENYYLTDYVRRGALLWLLAIFAIVAVGIGRRQGVTSLIGMAVSFLVIFKFILPRILLGGNPVLIAILGSLVIIPVTFFLSHGANKKTVVAMAGTLISLVITGLLASTFVEAAKLTGFASEEAGFLQAYKPGLINIKGLLLAGIIIGVLGVLDDITISQSAIVMQLKAANPRLKAGELYKKAMAVGKDHIASMVNTLILVYTGAALPLLLLFTDNRRPFSEVINSEIMADEIVRTLVGSVGLILAVPITTLVASLVVDREQSKAPGN